METSEAEAIRRVLAGDRDAFAVLMRRHFQTAYRVAYRMLGDAADAEEVVQEAFLRGYTRLPGFRQEAKFSTWMTRIVMNTAMNLMERRRHEAGRGGLRVAEETDMTEGEVTVADGGAGPERLLLLAEATGMRERAMGQLTPMERTAFVLRHMEDMPLGEIAVSLDVPVGSVKQAVFRAVGKLRQSLQPLAGGRR